MPEASLASPQDAVSQFAEGSGEGDEQEGCQEWASVWQPWRYNKIETRIAIGISSCRSRLVMSAACIQRLQITG